MVKPVGYFELPLNRDCVLIVDKPLHCYMMLSIIILINNRYPLIALMISICDTLCIGLESRLFLQP